MIQSAKIRHFKALDQLEVSNLSRINLIGGGNNAGKTTLMEAIFMFYDRVNPNFITRQFAWRGVDMIALDPDSLWAPLFSGYNMKDDIEISVTRNHQTEHMRIRFKPTHSQRIFALPVQDGALQIKTDPDLNQSSALEITFSKHSQIQKYFMTISNQGIGLEVENVSSTPKNCIFLPSKGHINPGENAFRYGQLDMIDNTDAVLEFLRIIEPRLKKLSVITMANGMPMVHGDIGVGRKIPINFMGDGISRLLSIILAIVANPNSLIFIDEIENGIHYSVLPRIWEMIGLAAKKYDCQVFATTHSYECLKSAAKGLPHNIQDEFRYIRLDRVEKEGTSRIVPTPFTYEILNTALDRGWEVR